MFSRFSIQQKSSNDSGLSPRGLTQRPFLTELPQLDQEIADTGLQRFADSESASTQPPPSTEEDNNFHQQTDKQTQEAFQNSDSSDISDKVESSINHERGGGATLPDIFRSKLEHAIGADFSGVRVHTDGQSDVLNRCLNSTAFTMGQDIFFQRNAYQPNTTEGQKLLAHELTHVAQQTPATIRRSGKIKSGTSLTIQKAGEYSGSSPMAKARVDQQAEEVYARKTQEYEFKMAPLIMENDAVNKVVDVLVGRVKRIVDAWAHSTGRELGKTYEREFGWQGGDQYYGAFAMTAENIQKVFEDKSQPMRTKLKLVYNAVRNNNLAKWLKIAALEIEAKMKNQKPKDQKIKTATQGVQDRQTGKIIKGRAEKETVKSGFAEKSGIESFLTKEQVTEFAEQARKEKKTEEGFSKRDVFGHDRFSGVLGWKQSTQKANQERTGFANSGLSLSEQRTLTVGDVSDLTDAEIEQMFLTKHNRKPTEQEKKDFRKDPNAKIDWSQGGEFYDINLGSESAKAANEFKARLEAGISGSTDLMLHAVENLGLGSVPSIMKGMRLALAGWMMANRDHSFYEVYKAAESYGVPFEIDKNNPGKEYESASNMAPMKPEDFKDILPEKEYPSYFLSSVYKDEIAKTLPEATKTVEDFKASLKIDGIDPNFMDTLEKRDIAELSRLSQIVSSQTINFDDRMALKNQAIRRIRLHPAYIYLGNSDKVGPEKAKAILSALLKTYHGGKGVAGGSSHLDMLADAGIPRSLLEKLPPKTLAALEQVAQAIKIARNQSDITKASSLIPFGDPYKSVIVAVLMQTYHGNKALTEEQIYKANAARMMAGHEESGAQKLSDKQLDDLQAPTPKGGNKIDDEKYWGSQAARDKLKVNTPIIANSLLAKMKESEKQKARDIILAKIFNGDQKSFDEQFKDVEKQEGFATAVTSFADAKFIAENLLPEQAKEALSGLENLHDKELGAIFQYTTALYKPIVNSANSFKTDDFTEDNLKGSVDWGSPLATLKYTGPMMQAISSGLAKLPVYPDKVYRLVTTSDAIMTKDLKARQEYAARYKPGTVETANYPMSSAKSLNSQFAKTNYGNPAFSVVYEIDGVKTGRDIQYVSDKVNEEEVLFPPGSRLVVVSAHPHNPNNSDDTHIWVKLKEV